MLPGNFITSDQGNFHYLYFCAYISFVMIICFPLYDVHMMLLKNKTLPWMLSIYSFFVHSFLIIGSKKCLPCHIYYANNHPSVWMDLKRKRKSESSDNAELVTVLGLLAKATSGRPPIPSWFRLHISALSNLNP